MKLEWQSNPPPQPMTWNETTEYIQSLGEDWRLPTISELKDYPNTGEKNKDVRYYWTSNLNANGECNAIGVSFDFGDVGYYGNTDLYHVRCVRHKVK